PQFEMLRPSRTSLPESITKSTSSRSSPVPLKTWATTAEMRSMCCAPLQFGRSSVCAEEITATLFIVHSLADPIAVGTFLVFILFRVHSGLAMLPRAVALRTVPLLLRAIYRDCQSGNRYFI